MAGFIQAKDISALEKEVIIEEILGLAEKEPSLKELCRVIKMDNLHATIRIATSLTGHRKVGELEVAPLSSQSYTTVTFNLWKNVVPVAISQEALLKSDVDILKLHVEDAARELVRMENQDIAEEMANATSVSGSDWTNDANDPADDVFAAYDEIVDNEKGYTPDVLAMHPKVYSALVSNKNTKDSLERGTVAVTGELEKFLGLKIVVNRYLPNNVAYVIDTKAPALVYGDGPTIETDIDGEAAFYKGFAIAKFGEPKLILSGAIRKITGVRT